MSAPKPINIKPKISYKPVEPAIQWSKVEQRSFYPSIKTMRHAGAVLVPVLYTVVVCCLVGTASASTRFEAWEFPADGGQARSACLRGVQPVVVCNALSSVFVMYH